MALYFEYGLDAIGHLKKKDKRLGSAIDRIGPIQRKTEDDLFTGVVHHIVGQQEYQLAVFHPRSKRQF